MDEKSPTKEFKAEAVRTYRASGRPLHEVAHDLGVAPSALRWWVELASIKGEMTFWGLISIPFLLMMYFLEHEQRLPLFAGSTMLALVGLPMLGLLALQVHILGQLTPAMSNGSKPDRCLLTIAATLLAINVAAAAAGLAPLVLGLALASLFYYAYGWMLFGLETLGPKCVRWFRNRG